MMFWTGFVCGVAFTCAVIVWHYLDRTPET